MIEGVRGSTAASPNPEGLDLLDRMLCYDHQARTGGLYTAGGVEVAYSPTREERSPLIGRTGEEV